MNQNIFVDIQGDIKVCIIFNDMNKWGKRLNRNLIYDFQNFKMSLITDKIKEWSFM